MFIDSFFFIFKIYNDLQDIDCFISMPIDMPKFTHIASVRM